MDDGSVSWSELYNQLYLLGVCLALGLCVALVWYSGWCDGRDMERARKTQGR